MRRRPQLLAALAALGVAAALCAHGCSNQGEGERCSDKADDCAEGLTCQRIEGQQEPLCCPAPGTRAPSVPECIARQKVVPDGGGVDSAGFDAQGDGSPDSPGSDGKDAPSETAQEAAPEAEASSPDAADAAPDAADTGLDSPADQGQPGQDADAAGEAQPETGADADAGVDAADALDGASES
jgi:hypothetical protein